MGLSASALAAPTAKELPAYTEDKLPNGLGVLAMESHKVPLATVVLSCKAGAMTETPDINGLTHLWEHMFFKGNKRLANQEIFNKRVRQLGISFNGDTAQEKVRYFFTLPSAFLDDGLQFMSDAISTPLLEQKELERERRVVQDEYDRAAAHPSFDFGNLGRNYIYGKDEYKRDPLGLRTIIDKATREQLLRIKDEVFVPSNCALLVGGDFQKTQLKALVAKHFSDWHDPKGWKALPSNKFQAFPKTKSFVMTRANVQNAQVQITFAGPKARSQPQDSYEADVLTALIEHRSGKFYHKFVDSGLTYQAALGYYTESQAGEIDLFGTTEPKNALKVRDALLAEIPLMAKPDYFNQQQLDDVRRKITINHKREINEPTEFIKSLAFWWAVTGLDYYGTYLDHVEQVTLADVSKFVNKWLVKKPYVAGILVSPQDAKAANLKDDSQPLVDQYLSMYKKTVAPQQPSFK